MYDQKSLSNILNHQDNLIFYKIMNYPVPTLVEGSFSRNEKNPYMQEYITYIERFWRLYRSLPFISSIYLCNSISFNALKENSDIDLFIVTKKKSLWRARFFSVVFFLLLWLKRSLKNKNKKFCLSFYITENAQNLYNITLPKTDIYFSYWLAHLIPLYQEHKTNIYQHNKRLTSTLPNFPQQHVIDIGSKMFTWTSRIKDFLEYFFWWLSGKFLEKIIKLIWLPIVIYKTKRHKEEGRGIVVNDNMLKFHLDIRKKVRVNYMLNRKNIDS